MISETTVVLQIALAALLGSMIGFERAVKDKPAGIRTHAVVCIATTLFTAVGFAAISLSPQGHMGHILAGIVTGVGFIGAGVIFREREGVYGITSAANLWAVAIIGITIGLGYYILAVAATVLIEAVLLIGRKIEEKLKLKN